jgi:prephenate dehydrogenase
MNNITSVGIIGHGRMGKIFEKMFQDFSVKIYDRKKERSTGIFADLETICEADLIIPCVPIPMLESVIQKISPYLKEGQTIMHICSVQLYPEKILLKYVPDFVNLIGSHPMFGPQTLKACGDSFHGLNFIINPIRCSDDIFNEINKFLKGLHFNMVKMGATEHDIQAAKFHFISHLSANILTKLNLKKTSIDTKSYEFLFNFLDRIEPNPLLLQSMLKYNPYAKIELELFEKSFTEVKNLLLNANI